MSFYDSREWRELRFKVLVHYGRKCMLCNATNKELHVDHIKPVSIFPQLQLDINNLQVLCVDCNLGKSNNFFTDLRPKAKSSEINNNKKIVKVNKSILRSISGVAGFIYKKRFTRKSGFTPKSTFHTWNGNDTLCRMHSTGGLYIGSKYTFTTKEPLDAKHCLNCIKAIKQSNFI